MTYNSYCEKDTFKIAKNFSKSLLKPSIILLYGDLGAGKTHFVKGLAKGLKYKNLVTSPTFTIMNVYEGGKCPIYHFDMYRIKNSQEAEILGFQDYFDKNQLDGISVIEWPEKIPEMINEWNYKVIINKLENENHRLIEIQKRS